MKSLPDRAGMSLNEIDEDFADFARDRAEAIAPGASWEEPDLPPDAVADALRDVAGGSPRERPRLASARPPAPGRRAVARAE